jgi:hypothetical protein
MPDDGTRAGLPERRSVNANLLLVATPRPLSYFGWIVGLATAA